MLLASNGSVVAVVGDSEIDTDTTAAVVAMAETALENATDELGLGMPSHWSVSFEHESWYIFHRDSYIFLMLGRPTKNPQAVSQKVLRALSAEGLS
jgi:predicted regulator of Ras-like GTPase activity (Roadblock/LC7/MglB family)